MGQFSVIVSVQSLFDPTKTADVELLVDTGAVYSFVPEAVLDSLGTQRLSQQGFRPFDLAQDRLADGRTVSRWVGVVHFNLQGRRAPVQVVFAEANDLGLLGAVALEVLGFAIDPIDRRLIPKDLLAAKGI